MGSFSYYRETFAAIKPPCIPFMYVGTACASKFSVLVVVVTMARTDALEMQGCSFARVGVH
jgi:hypothetical protein